MTDRTFFTEPGDSLLLSHDPIEAALRTQRVMHSLGVSNVVASPLTRLPLPFNGGRLPESGRPRSINPSSMWLPLWWLPRTTTALWLLDDGQTEGTNVMAVRLCLELEASGLYDPITGLWTDVLAPLGIDTTTEDGVRRIQKWLDGSFDEVLDILDEKGVEVSGQGRSILDSALWLQAPLYRCAWHDGALSLVDTLDEVLSVGELAAIRPIADVASTWFRGCDEWTDVAFKASLSSVLALREQLRTIVDSYADANIELVSALLA